MMVPGYLLRTVLTKHRFMHRLVPYTLQSVMKVPSYRSALGSLMCSGGAPGTPQIYARSLYTGRYLLNEQTKPKSLQTGDNKDQNKDPRAVLEDFQQILYKCLLYGVVCYIGYVIISILKDSFDPSAPYKLYTLCYEKCEKSPEVIEFFGNPINQYGIFPEKIIKENISVDEYVKGSSKFMRVTFLISGAKVDLGTVTADLKKNPESEKYDVEYIFVKIDTEPKTKLIVEDNRAL